MNEIIFIKIIMVSAVWTIFWIVRFIKLGVDPSSKTITFALCPWYLLILYVLFFWWPV